MDSNKPAKEASKPPLQDEGAETAQDASKKTKTKDKEEAKEANSQDDVTAAAGDEGISESLPVKKKKSKDPAAPLVQESSTSTLTEEENPKKKRSSKSKNLKGDVSTSTSTSKKPKKASNDVSEKDTTENSITENSTIDDTTKSATGKNAVFGTSFMADSLQDASRAEQERREALATLDRDIVDPEIAIPLAVAVIAYDSPPPPPPTTTTTPRCSSMSKLVYRRIIIVLVLVLVAIVAIAVVLTLPGSDSPSGTSDSSSRPTEGPTLPPDSSSRPTEGPTLPPATRTTLAPTTQTNTSDSSGGSVQAPAETKLPERAGTVNDRFGGSVSIDGDTIVVGAVWDDDIGINSGSAYIYTRTGGTAWTEQAKLTANDGAESDIFGGRVAVDGDTIVVGASGDDDNGTSSGSAYVFTRSGTAWAQQGKLTPSDGAAEDRFGGSVAVDGDTVVIGAQEEDGDNGSESGSAYIFTRTGTAWTEQKKLTASDGVAFDRFGTSVSVNGNTVAVVASGDDDSGTANGRVYVFTRTGTVWAQQAKLTTSGRAGSNFSRGSVAVDGDTIVMGANWEDDNGRASGSAYVFTRTGTVWGQQAKLTASDGVAFDSFGWSVAVDGRTIVIGSREDDDPVKGIASGSAYLFTRTGTAWTEQSKLTASDGANIDRFGGSVGVDGDTVVIGARGDRFDGGVYLFGI